jgi:hypothetical protein
MSVLYGFNTITYDMNSTFLRANKYYGFSVFRYRRHRHPRIHRRRRRHA